MIDLSLSRKVSHIICHPGGIFLIVDKAFASNLEDPYRMTFLAVLREEIFFVFQ
jgi:hypothetical protein